MLEMQDSIAIPMVTTVRILDVKGEELSLCRCDVYFVLRKETCCGYVH